MQKSIKTYHFLDHTNVKMDQFIKDNGKMVNLKEKVNYLEQMEVFMKESLKTINQMDSVDLYIQTVMFMKVIG